MTALCGLATNFWMLLMARIGVGVGEAGASPPSHSLISDYFPVDKRATALSIYALGIPFGTMIGSYVGGWGADELGWRYTFFLVGIPGIFVALIIALTLREPPRGLSDVKPALSADTQADPKPDAPRVSEVLDFLWAKVSFRHLSFAAGLHAFVSYGASTWNAPFFTRIITCPQRISARHSHSSPASALSVPLLAVISATSSRTAWAINVGTFGCPASQPSSWCHSSWLPTSTTAPRRPLRACVSSRSWAVSIWDLPLP